MGQNGGKRPGAGRKRGFRFPRTLEKEAARELVRQRVFQNLEPMLYAQMAHAQGIGHLFTRDKHGKYTKIENMAAAEKLLAEGEQDRDYFIFMKDPSVQAFTDLMNRALDKPKEQEQVITITGELALVTARLVNGRKRISQKG